MNATVLTIDLIDACCMPPTFTAARFAKELQFRMWYLLAVAATVLEYGGSEDMAMAALLHDAVEDRGGEPRLADIRNRFGDRVADIVRSCPTVSIRPTKGR